MDAYTQLVQDVKLPRMAQCTQTFERPRIDAAEVPAAVLRALGQDRLRGLVKPGMSVAVTCGSRGVHNIFAIEKAIVDFCKAQGAHPFILPAMGSHGGATAQGQLAIVQAFGITEETIGCPLRASMEVVPIGRSPEGHTVFIDKYAAEADGIIVVGRIKPHTAFSGPYESGLMKMMAIGLGKQHGAAVCHRTGFKDMAHMVPLFGNTILQNANVLCGVAILENAYGETAYIHGVHRDDIPAVEPQLLCRAKELMPELYIKDADVLIVERIGKNISGDGADPLIIGGFLTPYVQGGIDARRRIVLDLTAESHGNANGLGIFDATTKRLIEHADFPLTYPNAITSTLLGAIRIPIVMQNDRDCIAVALLSANSENPDAPRVIRIKNTMELTEISVSEALIPEVNAHPRMALARESAPMAFDADGNLLP